MARLIVALDLADARKAVAMVTRLLPEVDYFKVGLTLFAAEGPRIIREIKEAGASVFLDLKLHDIPAQVERACQTIAAYGVDMLTVHTLGGQAMMEAAQKGARSGAATVGSVKPLVVGVTILTSMDRTDLESVGVSRPVKNQVGILAGLAQDCGLDGVVASAAEVEAIRDESGPGFKIVTPGIRPKWAANGDQKRVKTPAEAVASGTDFIVVGRPITEAPDPKQAASQILSELAR